LLFVELSIKHLDHYTGVTGTDDDVAKNAQGTITCKVDSTDIQPTISFKDKDGKTVTSGAGITVKPGSWGKQLFELLSFSLNCVGLQGN
jgi:hypothetical protein